MARVEKALWLAQALFSLVPKLADLRVARAGRRRLSFYPRLLETMGCAVQLACARRRGEQMDVLGFGVLTCGIDLYILACHVRKSARWHKLLFALGIPVVAALIIQSASLTRGATDALELGGLGLVLTSKAAQVGLALAAKRAERPFLLALVPLCRPMWQLFMTMDDVTDPAVLYLFTLSLALDIILAAQCLYYT